MITQRQSSTREGRYWRAIERGASHEDALAFADGSSARPAAPQPPTPPAPRPSALGGFARGAGYGARETAASYAGGASWLAGGEGSGLGRALARAEEGIAGGFEPQTTAEKTGRIVGRVGTELGAAIAGGGLLVRGATAIPKLGRVATALQSSNRLQRGAAYAATQAPLDVLMGSRDESPLLLPERFGRPGAIAENIAITGAAGALFRPVRQARRAAEAAEEVPTTRVPETRAPETPVTPAREARAEAPRQPRATPRADEDAAAPVNRILEERPATYRKSDGTLRFGFEDPADGAAYILSTNRKAGAPAARRYLEGIGLNEDQIKDYARSVGSSLRKEARDYVFEQAEKGSTVFYYVPRIGAPEVAAVPAVRAATPARAARAARATEAAVPEVPVVRAAEAAVEAAAPVAGRRLSPEIEARREVDRITNAFGLPEVAQKEAISVGGVELSFRSNLEKAAYILVSQKGKGKSEIVSSVESALKDYGFNVGEVRRYGKELADNVRLDAATTKEKRIIVSSEDIAMARPVPNTARASVTGPEIASGVAGAALGGLAGATARDEEGEAQAGLGAVVGGALGGALGRGAGRRIAGDAGLIARGERSRPRAETFLGEVSKDKGLLSEAISRFRYNVVEETHPVLLLARHTLGRKAAQRLDGMIARSAGAAQEAMQYMRDKYDPFFRNYTKEQRDQIANFAVIRRASESGLSINMSPEEVARQYAEGMANPILKEGSDQLMGYFRDLLRTRYRAGLISDADYSRILQSDDYYVPFAADFAAETRRKASRAAPGWNVRDTGVGRMDREAIRDWNIQDPLEVLMEATLATHSDVAKRRAFNFIARAIDKAAVDMRQGKSNIANFIYRVDPNSKSAFEANRFTAITNQGKRVTYEVRDPELFQAITQQNSLTQGISMDLVRGLARFKRASIVLEPTFSLMQSIRDVPFYVAQRQDFRRAIRESAMGAAAGAVGGAATSEEDRVLQNSIAGALVGTGIGAAARPVVDLMKSLRSIVGNDETYREWLRMGGSSEGLRVRNPKDAQDILRRLERDGVDLRDVIPSKSWLDALGFIASVGEQMPRLAKYRELVARGVDPSVAIREGQAVTVRFASKGANPIIKEIASATPFFNAKIQGWDKLVQMAKDPKQATMAALVLFAPTVGLFMLNKDNPEYWDRPQWEKDNFWLVPKPEGGFYRVPKPFELGYAFASIPERYLSFAAETGSIESAAPRKNITGREALSRAVGTFALDPISESVPIPTAAEIPLSQAMNYDFFRRRDLIPQYYERIEPREQALPYTGALPRAIGQGTGISPIRVEKALSDIGGTGYRRFSEAIADPIIRSRGGEAPVQRARDMGPGPAFVRTTGLSRFVARDYDATQVEADARERLRKLEEKHQTLQMMRNQRRPVEEIRDYRERNAEELRTRNALNNLRIQLDRITAERRDIMRRRDLTPEQRDARMDALKRRGDNVSRRIVEYGAR